MWDTIHFTSEYMGYFVQYFVYLKGYGIFGNPLYMPQYYDGRTCIGTGARLIALFLAHQIEISAVFTIVR